MLHITFQTFSRSKYANRFLELYCLEHWGSKYLGAFLKYSGRESKCFELVGPHGGPVISKGVQILQHYSEVIGTVGGGGGGG